MVFNIVNGVARHDAEIDRCRRLLRQNICLRAAVGHGNRGRRTHNRRRRRNARKHGLEKRQKHTLITANQTYGEFRVPRKGIDKHFYLIRKMRAKLMVFKV